MEKVPSIEQSRREIISDPEQFRDKMRQFWQRDFDAETLRGELESSGQRHTQELLRLGYEMEVLRSLGVGEKEKPAAKDIFLLASQNEIKRGLVAKAAEKQGMFLQGTLFKPSDKEEEMEHEILKQLIKERRIPKVREYDPSYFAIDVAEAKVSNMRQNFKGQAIVGGDIVVLRGKQIFEKPKNKENALKMLMDISGKEMNVSLGVVLLTPTTIGKTILLKEGADFSIKLRKFSKAEGEQYLEQIGDKYQSVVGVLDYANPLTRRLIADTPVEIEILEFGRKTGEPPKKVLISPDVLPKLKDYFMGVPIELIEEMLKRVKSLT